MTQLELLYALGGALAVLLLAVLWLVLRLRHLQVELPDALVASVHEEIEAGHRQMLKDMHDGLGGETDRLIAAGDLQGARVRHQVDAELKATREAMQALQLTLQTQLGEQRGETQLRLTELANGVHSAHARLRSEMIEQTLATSKCRRMINLATANHIDCTRSCTLFLLSPSACGG